MQCKGKGGLEKINREKKKYKTPLQSKGVDTRPQVLCLTTPALLPLLAEQDAKARERSKGSVHTRLRTQFVCGGEGRERKGHFATLIKSRVFLLA